MEGSKVAKTAMISAHDIQAIAGGLSKAGRGKTLASFNNCTVGVARFSAHPSWERHPAGDELLQVFEGELDLTLLTEDGPMETTLRPGSVFVVPRGLWHSPRPRGFVTMLFVSDPEGTEVSNKKDPRLSE
jgi:mannose-6-phosphate isomerase-like protein (cupin superfamily)